MENELTVAIGQWRLQQEKKKSKIQIINPFFQFLPRFPALREGVFARQMPSEPVQGVPSLLQHKSIA